MTHTGGNEPETGVRYHDLRWIIAETPVVVYALRPTTSGVEPIWVCPNIERILAHNPQSAYDPGWWHDVVHPEDRSQVVACRQRAQADGSAMLQYRVCDGHGEYRWVHDELRLATDGEIVGAWTDVTDYKRIEAEQRHHQKLEAIGQLAGGVAHDLNNLVTAILGGCDSLRRRMADTDSKTDLDEVRDAAQQAAAITRQLLVFGRKQPLAPVTTGLNTALEKALALLQHLLEEHYRIEKRLRTPEPLVHVDPSLLQQSIINLAINARDAMPEGGTLIFETGITRRDGDGTDGSPTDYATLAVRDTGVGMSESEQARIFEPFFTSKGISGGTGLGLAMVYGFVQRSGGNVQVDSAPGVGTAITLAFESIDGETEAAVERSAPSASTGHIAGTVLLVEDDERVRRALVRTLSTAGYRVLQAADGDRAVELVQGDNKLPDVVITDLLMPTIGGQELVRRLRELVPDLPVLFISGYSEQWPTAETTGPHTRFLQKPFPMEDMLKEVGALLQRGSE